MEVYVDDMIVKSKKEEDHVEDLRETFEILRKHQLRLNPAKCSFGVCEGKFLGYIVNAEGIKANPAKTLAILSMPEPTSQKQVMKLTGCLAALGRFISKSAEKALPFFHLLSKNKEFVWTKECSEAFAQLKAHLAELPTLTQPIPGEPLSVYLAASSTAVSAVMVAQRGGEQVPIYFLSHVLKDAEVRYPVVKKVGFALLIASRKLRPYFQAHEIVVLTSFPLNKLLKKYDCAGRMLSWAVELSQFDISFRPRTAIKA